MPSVYDLSGVLLPRQDDGITCQSPNGQDYYGLGVRLGVYFAWLTGWIANTILPSEFTNASNTNTIFLLALLIAMANDARTGALTDLDALVLMHLCGGTVFGTLSLWGYRTRMYFDQGPRAIRLFGGFATHVKLFVSLGVSVFGFWFWLYGVMPDGLSSLEAGDGSDEYPNSPECTELYTFFFAKVRADGPLRYYYIVVCASCIAYFGIQVLVSSMAAWFSVDRIIGFVEFKGWASTNRTRYATGFSHKELNFLFKVLRVLNIAWLIFSAVMVECTLNFNHVTSVLGGSHGSPLQLPGQLLPMLLGTFSFVTICYKLFQEKVGEPKVEGAHPYDSLTPFTPTTPSTPAPNMPGPSEQRRHPGFDSLEMIEQEPPTPGHLEPSRHDTLDPKERGRSRPVRYLVAWLPWIGMVQHSKSKSRVSTLLRNNTGLSETVKIHHQGSWS
ncbi:hypothetical protein GQ53DRAFT_811347 [Thozetella sp. PMI_491]|nr:hypothetical protein GQ53DRAFT_811347 [Thozetella sp. PMI_491]